MTVRAIKIVSLISVLGLSALTMATSEIRSPLGPFGMMRGSMHYPLEPVDDGDWSVETWKTFYERFADKTFSKCWCRQQKNCTGCSAYTQPNSSGCTSCCGCCSSCGCSATKCSEKTSSDTAPLAKLFFGKADFRGEEAFADGMQIVPNNPWMSFAKISPRFEYSEKGAVFGMHVRKTFDNHPGWHVGGRAAIPFKIIKIENKCCKTEETLDDVMRVSLEEVTGISGGGASSNQVTYAYRLDFLTSLCVPTPGSAPLLILGDGTNSYTKIGPLTIVGDTPSVLAKHRNAGRSPEEPLYSPAVTTDLPADGSGPENRVDRFATATNYQDDLGKNREAQCKLFLIPAAASGYVLDESGSAQQVQQLASNARLVHEVVQAALETLDTLNVDSARAFFEQNKIYLCEDECITGLGDLDIEFYGGYTPKDVNAFIDGVIGLRIPTGKEKECPGRVLYQPTGNNGHFELKVGAEGGWKPKDWFAFRGDVCFAHAFSHRENKAAPFKGATIRNIGPLVRADVSWNYFLGHLDFSFFHIENKDLGCTFGYEFYAKGCDKVCLCKNSAIDLVEQEKDLDAGILQCCTNAHTHKIRTEVFHRFWYFELVIGGSYVFAGKNSMKEAEGHIGATVYF